MKLYNGDCLEIMPTLDENSIDTIITDPPYGLEFMGKDWDKGVPGVHFWREALRIAKPGATLLAMGGTRTFHRLVCAIEDAGWEVKDAIGWVYGSGFPKSYNISKGMDKQAGAEREVIGVREDFNKRARKNGVPSSEYIMAGGWKSTTETVGILTAPATPEAQQWDGWGTALKPAMELICVAQKPREGTYVENALKWGVAGLWIDGGRVETDIQNDPNYRPNAKNHNGHGSSFSIQGDKQRSKDDLPDNGFHNSKGRWPANVIHDGSDEVVELMDESARFFYCAKASRSERNAGLEGMEEKRKAAAEFRPNHTEKAETGDSGNPYGRWDKIQNNHPTVKPISLMEYLSRLTKTPTGGVVLDPFMGSGTTGIGAINDGRDFIGIEMNPEYFEIAKRRIEHWQSQPRQLTLDSQGERE